MKFLLAILSYTFLLTPVCHIYSLVEDMGLDELCATDTYDYIIVGNGTAGAVLARYLSNPINGCYKNSVLVLEAGPNYSNDPAVLNASFPAVLDLFVDPKYSIPQLVNAFTAPFGGLRGDTDFSQGRMWGGSSAHYHLFAVRGTADVYDRWALLSGSSRWEFKNLLPLMKFMEQYIPDDTIPNRLLRGLSGPLPITQDAPVNSNIFAQAVSDATGTPLVPDYNTVTVGVSARQAWRSFIDGKPIKTFSSRSFLPPNVVTADGFGVNGRLLRIISKATVGKIIFSQERVPTAIGVSFTHLNQTKVATARKKVIISAGNLSASLLQRSGVGPSQLLKSLGIPVIVDNNNVGSHLKNHYGVVGALNVDPSVDLPPLIMAFVDGKPYTSGPAGIRRFEIIVGYPPTLNSKIISSAGLVGQRLVTISCQNLRPGSTGFVAAPDNDPLNLTRINYRYYSNGGLSDPNSDASAAVIMFRIIQDIAAAASALSGGKITLAYPLDMSSSDLFRDAQDSNFALHHYTGTCRMAENEQCGVVGGNLHVFKTEKLMVVDASVMPEIPTGNTAYITYVIGLVAAQILGIKVI